MGIAEKIYEVVKHLPEIVRVRGERGTEEEEGQSHRFTSGGMSLRLTLAVSFRATETVVPRPS